MERAAKGGRDILDEEEVVIGSEMVAVYWARDIDKHVYGVHVRLLARFLALTHTSAGAYAQAPKKN